MSETVLAVHGGAGRLKDSQTREPARSGYEAGLAAALRAGQAVLQDGGAALDAVCAAVAALEDDGLFNAGRGAVLCADGTVELSASVMVGSDLSVGAVGGISRTRNPVLGARTMLPHMHGLLAGAQADARAEAHGLEMVDPDYFIVPGRREQWEALRGKGRIALDHSDADEAHGTVGAVAMDARGEFAAATSTGGLANQLPGRLGDTPVVGAGDMGAERRLRPQRNRQGRCLRAYRFCAPGRGFDRARRFGCRRRGGAGVSRCCPCRRRRRLYRDRARRGHSLPLRHAANAAGLGHRIR